MSLGLFGMESKVSSQSSFARWCVERTNNQAFQRRSLDGVYRFFSGQIGRDRFDELPLGPSTLDSARQPSTSRRRLSADEAVRIVALGGRQSGQPIDGGRNWCRSVQYRPLRIHTVFNADFWHLASSL